MTLDHCIAEQPDALEVVLEAVPARLAVIEGLQSARPLYLVGCGSSRNALAGVEPLFARVAPGGVRVRSPLAFLSETAETPRRKGAAVFLSRSGSSATTVEALRRARDLGWRTLALTAERQSPIAAAADDLVAIPMVGEPAGGPAITGYTASLLTLLLLAGALSGASADLTGFTADLAGLIGYARGAVAELAESCEGVDVFMVLGQDRHYGTALEGSLKLSEISGIPAAAFDTEEAFHGRFHGLGMFSMALFIAATPLQHDLATTGATALAGLGIRGRVFNLASSLPGPHDLALPWPATDRFPELDLIGAVVPFQLLACELARRKGLAPERPRYPELSRRLRIKLGGAG